MGVLSLIYELVCRESKMHKPRILLCWYAICQAGATFRPYHIRRRPLPCEKRFTIGQTFFLVIMFEAPQIQNEMHKQQGTLLLIVVIDQVFGSSTFVVTYSSVELSSKYGRSCFHDFTTQPIFFLFFDKVGILGELACTSTIPPGTCYLPLSKVQHRYGVTLPTKDQVDGRKLPSIFCSLYYLMSSFPLYSF